MYRRQKILIVTFAPGSDSYDLSVVNHLDDDILADLEIVMSDAVTRKHRAVFDPDSRWSTYHFDNRCPRSGVNPTISSYSASVVKIYNATNSIPRTLEYVIFLQCKNCSGSKV
jgi:hypothetical protein